MAPKRPFKIKPMQKAMKRLRKEIRQFDPKEIVDACITQLRTWEKTMDMQYYQRYPPWFLLLVIKWSLLYGRWDKVLPNKEFDGTTLGRLMNRMHNLDNLARLPRRQYDHPYLFMRNRAFQQLWLQEETEDKVRLARQIFLFGNLQDNHTFKREFKQNSGIKDDHFIELSLCLIGRFIWNNQADNITASWFDSLQASYPSETVKKFLSHISGDIYKVKSYLEQENGLKRNISYEIYEQSPLMRYPLLKDNDKYYVYSIKLLLHSLQSFIYDTLKAKSPGAFVSKFGKIFEEYVGRGIDYMGLPYKHEHTLQKTLEVGKAVDFLVVNDNCNILIDAKGVEMNQLGMVGHKPEVIHDKTKTSVVKGIRQGTEVAYKLKDVPQIDGLQTGCENFLLVVTYKDFYVGNGKTFYEAIERDGRERVDEIRAGYDTSQLPYENMYFISVDDFDYLVRLVHDGQCGLAEAIKTIREADREPSKSTFLFRHGLLKTHFGNRQMQMPEYLEDEFKKIMDTLSEKLSN